ncbi:MAG: baseplate J/gp47 family protein, partial [Pseudomonadota bacterium]
KVQWSYLAGDRWCPFSPREVLADTTEGFLSSGIVTLDVPAQIDRSHRAMPDGLYWLRASTDTPSDHFAQLVGVAVNAVSTVRVLDAEEAPTEVLAAGSIDRLAQPIAGVNAVLQPDASTGGRRAEDQHAFETRVAERLRHRARAVQPWDYERLVLEAFPEVFKVKCFSALAEVDAEPVVRPGQVLVVVVPNSAQGQGRDGVERGLQGAALARIREYLQARAPIFANVQVRNPIYERIQVRCTVKLAPGAHTGEEIARINRTISRYISPWERGGYGAVFGWRMRRQDLEAVIRALDAVEFVTDFSMLHITRDATGHYRMDDTARQGDDWIRPRYPWSLALPMAEHYIELVDDYREISPRVTGIGELQVGSTLIVAPDTAVESEESSS